MGNTYLKLGVTVLLLLTDLGSISFASEISARGVTLSSTGCSYYSFDYFQAEITYTNLDLRWGSSIELNYGFHDSCGIHDRFNRGYWVDSGHRKLEAVAPYSWSATLSPILINSKGHFLNTFEFVFKITHPDGTVVYDNGGLAPMGYYGLKVPRVHCAETPLTDLIVDKFHEHDPRER